MNPDLDPPAQFLNPDVQLCPGEERVGGVEVGVGAQWSPVGEVGGQEELQGVQALTWAD